MSRRAAYPQLRPRASVGVRVAWGAALLPAAALAGLLGISLLADLYEGHGRQRQQRAPTSEVALQAAAIAARLAPWRAQPQVDRARNLSRRGESRLAVAEVAPAVRLAPASAALWVELARRLARDGQFGARLSSAVDTAQRLAPNARPVHLAIAVDGVAFWRHGSDPLREQWLRSMRYSTWRNTRLFLLHVVVAQREPFLCAYAGDALQLGRWCERARGARRFCAQSDLTRKQQHECWKRGYLRPPAGTRKTPP